MADMRIEDLITILILHQTNSIYNGCSMGAASCHQAVQLVGNMFETAKVIYAQTDSVFVHFQGASIDEAIKLGTQAAEIVSQAFPSPMALKFERVRITYLS